MTGRHTIERTPQPGYYVSRNPKRRPGSAVDDRWTNPILDVLRDSWDSGDPWGSALSALGALQDYTPGDPVNRAEAEEGVIDSRLADLADIWDQLVEYDFVEGLDNAAENERRSLAQWDDWEQHAHRVFDRYADLARLNGRDY